LILFELGNEKSFEKANQYYLELRKKFSE
jgi:hypothetical protein